MKKKNKLAKAHKNDKRRKHIPQQRMLKLQRRMLNLTIVTNPDGSHRSQTMVITLAGEGEEKGFLYETERAEGGGNGFWF